MKINRCFFLFLWKSLSQRKGRILITSVSVTFAAAIVVSAVSLSLGIREKLGKELKAYGANIMVISSEGYLDERYLDNIKGIEGIEEYKGQIFGNAMVRKNSIEIIGLDLELMKETEQRGWKLKGRLPHKGEVLAGINIKNILNLKPGDPVVFESGDRRMNLNVSGFVELGGSEDNSFMLNIKDAQALLGLDGKLSAILIRGNPERVHNIIESIKKLIPGSDVKTLKQVAYAEESLLRKIQMLMALVTLVVLVASAISVASTMAATVLERREEIGLMKAIGGTRKDISVFYWAEALIIGAAGGIAGFILGFFSAQVISKGAFNSYISVPLYISALSLALGFMISMFASHFPVKEAMRNNAAVILRGE